MQIDYEKTKEFFENRAKKKNQVSYLSLTMYQDKNPDLAEQRDRDEKSIITPFLELDKNIKVLDIGCGVGRWANIFKGKVSAYLGLDFSEELLQIANSIYADSLEINFQKMSATELNPELLLIQKPFDLIIISGLLIYLNDLDIKNLIDAIILLSKKGTIIYLREPISLLTERKILIDHFSKDLNSSYHAIYRTQRELEDLVVEPLTNDGFSLKTKDFLFHSDSLDTKKDTKQYFFILKK